MLRTIKQHQDNARAYTARPIYPTDKRLAALHTSVAKLLLEIESLEKERTQHQHFPVSATLRLIGEVK